MGKLGRMWKDYHTPDNKQHYNTHYIIQYVKTSSLLNGKENYFIQEERASWDYQMKISYSYFQI